MLTFANPVFLLLALAVPLLVWWWLHRRRAALHYPETGFLAGLPAGRSRFARWAETGLRALALLLLIIALAGPRWPGGPRIVTEAIAIEMVVDVSGSMAERDFLWENQSI